MLNHFVFEDGDYLVNLTTKKVLPKSSPDVLLRDNFFLEGQEKQSVDHYLFSEKPTDFAINLIPTWECNLRCSHCFVLHELKKKDSNELNADLVVQFVQKLIDKYPSIQRGNIHFIGGEPTLRSRKNLDIIEKIRNSNIPIQIRFTTTSNGYDCDDVAIEFLSSLDVVTISVDGPKEWHDKQRKSCVDKDLSPFDSSISTIKKLIVKGMRNKLTVQASLPEEAMTQENIIELYKVILMCGVKYEKIMPGFVAPTRQNPKIEESFLKVSAGSAYVRPCCKYRFMKNFVIDSSNRVFCDLFDANKHTFLGNLTDSINDIANSHERVIRASMPVLNDDKCKKCPVIGLCWGWCANTKALKPSDYCTPELLLEKVKKNSSKGNLVNFLRNTKKNDISCASK